MVQFTGENLGVLFLSIAILIIAHAMLLVKRKQLPTYSDEQIKLAESKICRCINSARNAKHIGACAKMVENFVQKLEVSTVEDKWGAKVKLDHIIVQYDVKWQSMFHRQLISAGEVESIKRFSYLYLTDGCAAGKSPCWHGLPPKIQY